MRHDATNLRGNVQPPSGDYLWDRSPPVLESISRLESILSPLALQSLELRIDASSSTAHTKISAVTPRSSRLWMTLGLAAAAALVVLCGVLILAQRKSTVEDRSWFVASSSGGVSIKNVHPGRHKAEPEQGLVIETASDGTARLQTAGGASVTLESSTRVRSFDLPGSAQRLRLEAGRLYVDGSATATDIEIMTTAGIMTVSPMSRCMFFQYSNGSGDIETKQGRVTFRDAETHTRIGAFMRARFAAPGRIETPYRGDAPTGLTDALAQLDQTDVSDSKAIYSLLSAVLASSRPEDQGTLWNLMWRTDAAGRKRIIGRIRSYKHPVNLNDDALIQLNPDAMEVWWSAIER